MSGGSRWEAVTVTQREDLRGRTFKIVLYCRHNCALAMEPYFDEEIGMWMYDEQPETQEDKWAAEAEVMDVESRAQQVAMEVADEVALLEQQLGYTTTATTDWVQWGNSLLDEIGMYQPTLPNSAYAGLGVHADRYPKLHCRRRHKDPTPDLTCAPWGILLSTDLPLGCHFHPRDQVRLRGVCYALRGEKSTSDHLTQILDHLGIRVRLGQPEQLFHLTCRVFDELTFVQRTREVVAQAIGLRSDDPGTANLCHVSGSYALNRLMLVGDRPNSGSGGSRDCGDHNSILSEGPKRTIIRGLADGRQRRAAAPRSCPSAQGGDVPTAATGISWTPGDIDIFVGCHGAASTKKSVASFSALVEHAKASCHLIYRNARVRHSFRMLSAVFGTEFRDPTVGVPVEPTVKVSSEYEGWGGHIPAGVEAAMSTRGQSYHRDVVLASMWSGRYASMWSSELRDTITHLQPTLGIRRPIRVERVAEVRPFKVCET